MRKNYSIFLLGCFCLYYFGHLIYFFALQHRLDKEWETSIWEESYDHTATELLKIPLSLPYMANQEHFQTTNLSMEIGGQNLRVIKQRYQNDTLQIVYLKDLNQQKLKNEVADWIKIITNESQESPVNKNQFFAKFFPKDFIRNELYIIPEPNYNATQLSSKSLNTIYSSIVLDLKSLPPKFG